MTVLRLPESGSVTPHSAILRDRVPTSPVASITSFIAFCF